MKKNNGSHPNFSKYISDFLFQVANAKEDYDWNQSEISRLDRLTQDYLHKLELEKLDYRERAKLATKLMICRKERRESKDTVEILEPLISLLESENGKKMINLMKNALGSTRKIEERMHTRIYRYKESAGIIPPTLLSRIKHESH